jgi:hypothetical protein
MNISAKGFLRFVGFEYLAFGIAGITSLLVPSRFLLVLVGFGAVTLLVTPLRVIFEYGIQSSCFELPRGACNLNADEVQHARAVIMVLCTMSVAGGLAAIWAASTKDKQAGRAVWLVLIVVSVAVVLWNLKGMFFTSSSGILSTCWVVAYTLAYFRWLRSDG